MAEDAAQRQQIAAATLDLLKRVLDENTALTKRIDELTRDIHTTVVPNAGP